MDGVPLKMPQGASHELKEEVKVIIPDYLTILQETGVSVVSSLSPCVLYVCMCNTQAQLCFCVYMSSPNFQLT